MSGYQTAYLALCGLLLGCVPEAYAQREAARVALRVSGIARGGELGFRFGSPQDVDGDGVADLAAGARFTERSGQSGTVSVWSGKGGERLFFREGLARDGLLGQAALLLPDPSGGGRAALVVSAPAEGAKKQGALYAYDPYRKARLWRREGQPFETLGWDLALAADHDGDGVSDLFVGAPSGPTGAVYLLSGRDGRTLRAYPSAHSSDGHGWRVSTVPDLDGDGREDLVVGAPMTRTNAGHTVGAARVISSRSGRIIHTWFGPVQDALFGEMVCGLSDLDGDGAPEIAVGAPHTRAETGALEGAVTIYSGGTGQPLGRLVGRQRGELYGRMVARAGDLDGDGTMDIAIGAPWHAANGLKRAGRFEVRSGRTGALLLERVGTSASQWLGWHMAPGRALGPHKRAGLVVASLRSTESGLLGAGAVEVLVYSARD